MKSCWLAKSSHSLNLIPLSFLNANGYCFTFFSPFFISNFCLFCQKGKSSVLTALPFFVCFCLRPFLLCWESLLFFSLDLAPIHFLPRHPHLAHHVPPPPPLFPRRRRYAWPFRSMRQQIISCRCHRHQPYYSELLPIDPALWIRERQRTANIHPHQRYHQGMNTLLLTIAMEEMPD